MDKNKFFSGATHFFLLDARRPEVEVGLYTCPDVEERMDFTEYLNVIVYRVSNAYDKIVLVLEVLEEYENNSKQSQNAVASLTLQLIEDMVESNLLEMAQILNEFSGAINTKVHGQYGQLFRRIGKDKLKEFFTSEQIEQYINTRKILFPLSRKDNANVTCEDMAALRGVISEKVSKLVAFRDRVIAHKSDLARFNTHLSYEDFFKIYEEMRKVFDAIAIVGSLKENDCYSCENEEEKNQTRQWLRQGLGLIK